MGYNSARDFADQADIDLALTWHLTSNHYPPVPTEMVPVCKAAINHAIEGEWDTELDLPEGVSYRDRLTAPVSAIVEAHHLDAFIDAALDDDDYYDDEEL